MLIKFDDFLFESAPRIPSSEEYWKKKGKSGKDVCLVFHDDLDGCVSAIIVKKYLKDHDFNIKQYGVINYQEGWKAFKIDPKLIVIALDFAEDIPGVDLYIDHHGSFSEDVRVTQQRPSIKTKTGSAAEGIAIQLGVPFSEEIKDWIDMIDSAKYDDYNVDIKGILDLDLKNISKSSNSKLEFAASFNQMLKRSDHKTFIEVVNACDSPSIYNIYRLFKIFFPKNNIDRYGREPDFDRDAKKRLATMQTRTRGSGSKVRYTDHNDFWKDFSSIIKDDSEKSTYKLTPSSYQIIGNLMYVPSGTWANALRAKAIFSQDMMKGIVPDDPKLNFILLQYGNTLQLADLRGKIKDMKEEDLPRTKDGKVIDNLGKYTEDLVKNFETHLDYKDDRTKAGGHYGIGSISNIFGKCKNGQYQGLKYLDMFKNKIINDISGVKWPINMPWNEKERDMDKPFDPKEINKKLVDIKDVRSEEMAKKKK
jgi:hypothetical protein